MIDVYVLIRLVLDIIGLVALACVLLLFIGSIASFFSKVRRRRRAMMEDTIPEHDEWKGGNPNAPVPASAKPIKFDPDDFVG